MRVLRRLAASLIFVLPVLGLNAGSASAQEPPTLSGKWSASALTAKWVIGEWGSACGPQPSGGGAPATQVGIVQTGRELMITGGGRTYSTTNCWEEYPGLRVISHSAGARSWKTSCKTAVTDPRQATLTTTLTATDDTISFYEAGQYQFVIKGQNCTASVGRYRTFQLLQREGETPPVASTPAAPEPSAKAPAAPTQTAAAVPQKPSEKPCATVGPPTRLEIRPSRKLMRPGEEFTFRSIVYDSKGCSVRTAPAWTATSGAEHIELSQLGTVKVRDDAPEGVVELAVSVGGRSAQVTVEVASKQRYEALLKSGGFDEAGEAGEAASVAIASSSVGAKAVVAEDKAADRKTTFLAIVGAVALALGVVGVVVLRRSRKRVEPPPPPSPSPAPEPAPAPPPPPPQVVTPAPPSRKICPVCGTQYPPESRFCGSDGATLVPIN